MNVNCTLALSIVHDPHLYLIYVSKAVFSLVALFLVFRMISQKLIVKDVWLTNVNCRILIYSHMFWVIELPLSIVPIIVVSTIKFFQEYPDPCDAYYSYTSAITLKIFYVIGVYTQVISMFIMCLERSVATIYLEKYEQITKPYFGIVLGIITNLSGTVLCTIYNIIPIKDWNGRTEILSAAVPETAHYNRAIALILFGVEALTILIFMVILRRNHLHKVYFKKRIPNIANKYQVKENQAVIEKLLPVCIIHFVIMGVNCFGYSLARYFVVMDDLAAYTVYLEYINQAFLYSLIMPLVIEYISKKRAGTSKISTEELDQDGYFNSLKDYFNQPLRYK